MADNKVGRPPLSVDDLPKDWKDRILALAKDGASIIELAVELDIGRTTFYKLSERDEEFANTVKRCKRLSEAWWLRHGRTNLQNKDFSYVGWYMNMKNRFGWRDRQDITSDDKQLPILGGMTNVQSDDSAQEDSRDADTAE